MKNKYVWIVVVVAVVVVAYMMMKNGSQNYLPSGELTLSSPTASPMPGVVKKGTGSSSPSASSAPKKYTDLVKEYGDRRIQFDKNCQAVPSFVTFKNGTSVMLDNRSGDARVVTLGGVKYSLAGYGYQIVYLSSPTIPKQLMFDCGAAVNVGTVLLQALISQ